MVENCKLVNDLQESRWLNVISCAKSIQSVSGFNIWPLTKVVHWEEKAAKLQLNRTQVKTHIGHKDMSQVSASASIILLIN